MDGDADAAETGRICTGWFTLKSLYLSSLLKMSPWRFDGRFILHALQPVLVVPRE